MIIPGNIKPGELVTEAYSNRVQRKRLVEWNYRDVTGKLHAGVAKTYEAAVEQAAKHGYVKGGSECTL